METDGRSRQSKKRDRNEKREARSTTEKNTGVKKRHRERETGYKQKLRQMGKMRESLRE